MALAPSIPRPPANEAPLADDGTQHSQAWGDYHQSVSDELATLAAKRGVTDGSEALAGQIGEYMAASGSGVALANMVITTIATLNLTAGDWDVVGNVQFVAGAGNHNLFAVGIDGLDTLNQGSSPTTAINAAMNTFVHRYNVATATAVNLVAEGSFSGTVTASGTIRARRMR